MYNYDRFMANLERRNQPKGVYPAVGGVAESVIDLVTIILLYKCQNP